MPKEAFLLAIDGGGTKTRALIADRDGRILGRGMGGPSNYHTVGETAAYTALDHAITDAARQGTTRNSLSAMLPFAPSAICLGMAGAGREEDRAIWQAWAEARYPGVPVRIVHDGQLALAAGTPETWGIAVLCGTGSLVYGQLPDGRNTRAGGWGYLLGDEGSGYALGLAALQAVARAADGRGPATTLTSMTLAHWGLGEPQDLIHYVYHSDMQRDTIAALAEFVDQAAAEGDLLARTLITDAAHELALAVHTVAQRLKISGPIPCTLAGGVIVKGQTLAAAFHAAIIHFNLSLMPVTRVHEPALGAVRIAQKLQIKN